MEHRTTLPFLIFSLLVPRAAAAGRPPQSTQPELITPQGTPEAATSKHLEDVDSIVVPDRTPLRIKVVNGFSSATAKVGDVIDFAVAFSVQVDGIVVIPQRTALVGKVVSVSRPHRGARGGRVSITFQTFSLPTGEAATVRPVLRPLRKKAEAGVGVAELATLPPFAPLTLPLLLAIPFVKGDEQVVSAGTIEVVYLNGPLRVSRKAAMGLQPAPGSGSAFIFNVDPYDDVRRLFCGQRLLGTFHPSEVLQLELNPGTYWFSTGVQGVGSLRIDVLENRQYVVGPRGYHGPLVEEWVDRGFVNIHKHYGVVVYQDLTNLTVEEYRSLAAQPVVKENFSPAQKQ